MVAEWIRTVQSAQEPSIRGLVEGANAYHQTPQALEAALNRLLLLVVTTAEDHEAARETFGTAGGVEAFMRSFTEHPANIPLLSLTLHVLSVTAMESGCRAKMLNASACTRRIGFAATHLRLVQISCKSASIS